MYKAHADVPLLQASPKAESPTTTGECRLCLESGHAVADCPELNRAAALLADDKRRLSVRGRPEHTKAHEGRCSTTATNNKSELQARITRFLLTYYPLIALLASCCISVPLAFYKWQLALGDESTLAHYGFTGTASDLAQLVNNAWKFAFVAPSMVADFYISMNGTFKESTFETFSNPLGYFSLLNKDITVSVYQHVTPDTMAHWQETMFETYGGNFGSNTTFSFYKKVNGSVKVIDTTSPDFYILTNISNDTNASNRASIGFNGYSDRIARGPLMDLVGATGEPAGSSRSVLTHSVTPASAVVQFAPVFKDKNGMLSKVKTNGSELYAVGSCGIDVQQTLADALALYVQSAHIHVFLIDDDAVPGASFLGHYSLQPHPIFDNYTLSSNLTLDDAMAILPYDFIYSLPIVPVQRRWRVVVVAGKGYRGTMSTFFPTFLLLISLVEPAFSILFHTAIALVERLVFHI
ncbi:hypothetical protein HK101_008462 [Irineochytrium annulatum]|nr:hypothetical protein HK101_008462 [Irineochytrium annulatum]